MNVFLPEYLTEKHRWFAESALQYISTSCFLYKLQLEKCAVLTSGNARLAVGDHPTLPPGPCRAAPDEERGT